MNRNTKDDTTHEITDGHQAEISLHLFRFEEDFAADLRCIPMAVRRKLDLAGVKLKLVHWHGLTEQERQRLLLWRDNSAALRALREWLLARSASLPHGPAQALDPVVESCWQQGERLPEVLRLSCTQLQMTVKAERWRELDELQRFALVKLSHPGHEHRNLVLALGEFQMLAMPAANENQA
jgi:hypothetical protein